MLLYELHAEIKIKKSGKHEAIVRIAKKNSSGDIGILKGSIDDIMDKIKSKLIYVITNSLTKMEINP